jgi:glyoxylase-like metal-dependent hydrolase (beta-lactamase superfamily II)
MSPKRAAGQKRKQQAPRVDRAIKDDIIVRMYDVGFGDAFLVRIPTSDGVRKILFDCGSVAAGAQPMDDVVKSIVDAVSDDGFPLIDVVVATHRHKDHVSGFANNLWQTVSVKEVWMPWTEHPTDREARRIREAQARLAAQLNLALTRKLQAAVGDPALMRLQELALNALSNEAAMRTLHHGFARPPQPLLRFLPDSTGRILETGALPGVVIHVMGPSRDEAVIRDMDPPAGKSYLRFVGATGEGQPQVEPFLSEWAITSTDIEWQGTNLALSADDEERLRSLNQDMDLAAAVALDKAVNGTSLMLMLQVGQTYLLFPGDAQWGTWQLVLEDMPRLIHQIR